VVLINALHGGWLLLCKNCTAQNAEFSGTRRCSRAPGYALRAGGPNVRVLGARRSADTRELEIESPKLALAIVGLIPLRR
jgi:hypothetical protein